MSTNASHHVNIVVGTRTVKLPPRIICSLVPFYGTKCCISLDANEVTHVMKSSFVDVLLHFCCGHRFMVLAFN